MPHRLGVIGKINQDKIRPLFMHPSGELKSFSGIALESAARQIFEGSAAIRTALGTHGINAEFTAGGTIRA